MDIDGTPAPDGNLKKSAAEARAERAARRKQRREELASQGRSATSSLASTPNPETEPLTPAKPEKKSKKKNPDKKSTPKKSQQVEDEVETEAPTAAPESAAPAAESEPLPLVIDVQPSEPAVVDTDTGNQSASERCTSVAPSTVNAGEGLNRAARRRLMQIEKHRAVIKKDLGIPAESNERQEEVDNLLAAWTTRFDEKAQGRLAKKAAKRQAGKVNGTDKQKQIKKQKQKKALRERQEAVSRTS